MEAEELKTALDALGLTQSALAFMVGSDARTVRYYVAGDRAVPNALAVIVRMLMQANTTRVWKQVADARQPKS